MAPSSEACAAAFAVIQATEPCRLVAYMSDHGVMAIGYGLSSYASGAVVRTGDVTSPPVARAEMLHYLEHVLLPEARELPGWSCLGLHRRAALLSFMQGVGTRVVNDPRCANLLAALEEGEGNPSALNAVAAQMKRFVIDPLGTVKPQLTKRREHEASLWQRESGAMTELRAIQDTFLKKAPIDARYFSDEGRRRIGEGESIRLSRLIEIPQDSHDWLVLDDSPDEQWAAYMPHWEQADAPIGQAPTGRLRWNDLSSPLGRYLTVGEILRYDYRRQPLAGSIEERNLKRLGVEFDAIRTAWEGPIAVTGGYRPEPINREVGGAPGSYHVTGQAMDICPVHGSLDDFYHWLRRRWSGGLGDGRSRGSVSIDMRNQGRFHARGGVAPCATWTY